MDQCAQIGHTGEKLLSNIKIKFLPFVHYMLTPLALTARLLPHVVHCDLLPKLILRHLLISSRATIVLLRTPHVISAIGQALVQYGATSQTTTACTPRASAGNLSQSGCSHSFISLIVGSLSTRTGKLVSLIQTTCDISKTNETLTYKIPMSNLCSGLSI